jgi:hypothetical protein
MPCYQSTNLPGGFSTTGRTSYATEADCLQACKEGACCEGTSCTVKPQCQCQGTGKVFKGVGTVCEPGTCLCCNTDGTPKQSGDCATVSPCWCLCGEGSAAYPRFVNVSISFTYTVYRFVSQFPLVIESKEKTVSGATFTMTLAGEPSRDQCPQWTAGVGFFGIIMPIPISLGGGAEGVFQLVIVEDQSQALAWRLSGAVRDISEAPTWTTALLTGSGISPTAYGVGGGGSVGGPYASGACFSAMSTPYAAGVSGLLRDYLFSINGVQP